ncbi:AP-3 complex subunit mu-2, partial [Plecturocebus cupreus]
MVGPKQAMGKTIEGVTVTSQMLKEVLIMSLIPPQVMYTFGPVTEMLFWGVGKTNPYKLPSLRRMMSLHVEDSKPESCVVELMKGGKGHQGELDKTETQHNQFSRT